MSDLIKIWKLEFRKQRFILGVFCLFSVFLFLLFLFLPTAFSKIQGIRFSFLCAFSVCGFLISMEVATKDFQRETIPLLLSFPISAVKIFLAKYTYSLFEFFLFFCTGIFIALYSMDFQLQAMALKWQMILLTTLLLLHSICWLWGIVFRMNLGMTSGFFAIPLTFLFVLPLGVVLYPLDILRSPNWAIRADYFRLLYVLAALFLLHFFTTLRLWTRYIVYGRSILKPMLCFCAVLILLPLSVWCVYHAVWINTYCKVLTQLESLSGISSSTILQRGHTIAVQSGVWNFGTIQEKDGRAAAIRNLESNMTGTVNIQQKEFSAYDVKKAKMYDDFLAEIKDCIAEKRYSRLPELVRILTKVKMEYGSSYYYLPRFFGLFSDIIRELPCSKETLPVLDVLIGEIEKIPEGRNREWVLILYSYYGNVLPGSGKKGFARLSEIFEMIWVSEITYPIGAAKWNGLLSLFDVGMPGWMYLVGDMTWKIAAHQSWDTLRRCKTTQDLFMTYFSKWGRTTVEDFRTRFLTILQYRLQKYFIRHGTLTDDVNILFTPEEAALFNKYRKELFGNDGKVRARLMIDNHKNVTLEIGNTFQDRRYLSTNLNYRFDETKKEYQFGRTKVRK